MAVESAIRLQEVNLHIDPYKRERPPKHHQVQLLDIMERDLCGFSGSLLDVGCASGAFLALASERFPDAKLEGLDVSEELVGLARARPAVTGTRLKKPLKGANIIAEMYFLTGKHKP